MNHTKIILTLLTINILIADLVLYLMVFQPELVSDLQEISNLYIKRLELRQYLALVNETQANPELINLTLELTNQYAFTYEKIQAINDWVAQKTTYGNDTLNEIYLYPEVLNHSVDCEDIAILTGAMLNIVNISNRLMVTKPDNDNPAWHAMNIAKEGGVWYELIPYGDDDCENCLTRLKWLGEYPLQMISII